MTTGGLGRLPFLRRSVQAAVASEAPVRCSPRAATAARAMTRVPRGRRRGRPHRRRCRRKMRRSRGSCGATSSPVTDELEVTELRGHAVDPGGALGAVRAQRLQSEAGLGAALVPRRRHGARRHARRTARRRGTATATCSTTLLAAGGGLTATGAPGGAAGLSNVSIVHHGGKLLTLGEVGLPYELAPRDLSTVGAYDYDGQLHGQHDRAPEDRSRNRATCTSSATTSPSRTSRTTSPIATGGSCRASPSTVKASTMIHDFAITDRDVIFWEMPGPLRHGSRDQDGEHTDARRSCRTCGNRSTARASASCPSAVRRARSGGSRSNRATCSTA